MEVGLNTKFNKIQAVIMFVEQCATVPKKAECWEYEIQIRNLKQQIFICQYNSFNAQP